MNQPIYDPVESGNSLRNAPWKTYQNAIQVKMLEKAASKYGKDRCWRGNTPHESTSRTDELWCSLLRR